jgi:MFS family permease
MPRLLAPFVIGGCLFATSFAVLHLVAPFAGQGLTLSVAIAVATLLGFALGSFLGSGAPSPTLAGRHSARALFVAAVFTFAAALLRRPLLVALSGVEMRVAVSVASGLLAGLPAAALGRAFAVGVGDARAADATRALAAGLLGAAFMAPIAGFVLVPRLGLTLTLAIVTAVEGALAFAVGARGALATTAAGAVIVLAAAGWLAARPAAAARIGPTLLEHRQAACVEYRVFDRDGARYLTADGDIQAVVDTLSGDCVQRGPSALELLKRFRTGRDSMLVLGLRGGALPLAFARSGWRVCVVERDSVAATVSRRVSYRPGEMRLEVADPRRFVREDDERYSVAVVDAFAAGEPPWTLCTREFVADLARRVTPDGLVVMLVEAHGWGDPLVGSLGATLRTRFAHVQALPTSEPQDALGTIVLLASHEPVPFTDDDLPDPTTFFQNPDALWVAQQQMHAWLNRYAPEPVDAPVLTDDRNPAEVWGDRINRASRAELHRFFGPDGGSW